MNFIRFRCHNFDNKGLCYLEGKGNIVFWQTPKNCGKIDQQKYFEYQITFIYQIMFKKGSVNNLKYFKYLKGTK